MLGTDDDSARSLLQYELMRADHGLCIGALYAWRGVAAWFFWLVSVLHVLHGHKESRT